MNRLALALTATALALTPGLSLAQSAAPQSGPAESSGATTPPPSGSSATSPTGTPQTGAPSSATQAQSIMPQQFVEQAATSGLFEVQAGQVAAVKAQSQDVKDFAQRMVDDHTRVNDDLGQLAQRKNLTVPSSIDAQHQAQFDQLNQLSGRDFERQYMQGQVQAHQQAVQLFQGQASQSQDQDIRTFASSHLPTLRNHLEQAQNLSGQGLPTAQQ